MRRIALALIPMLAACGAVMGSHAGSSVPDMHVAEEWKADLVGTGAAAGMKGDAKAVTDGTRSQVTLNLQGGAPGRSYPWHVHSGVCGATGAVVGPAGAYPLAVIGTDGKTTATAHLNFPLSKTGRYYVNVHASTRSMATIVACAPLSN
jgi:hypothetical protein